MGQEVRRGQISNTIPPKRRTSRSYSDSTANNAMGNIDWVVHKRVGNLNQADLQEIADARGRKATR